MKIKIDIELMEAMAEGGASASVIIGYVKQQLAIYEAWCAARRPKWTAKKQRQRARDTGGTGGGQVEDTGGTDDKFEQFWKLYPKRKGDNPKAPARKVFEMLVKQGVNPDDIIAGVKLATERNRDKVGTEFIPQATKWLRDRRFEDHVRQPVPSVGPIIPDEAAVKFFKQIGRWHRDYGPEPGQIGCRVSAEILAKYGYSIPHETHETEAA